MRNCGGTNHLSPTLYHSGLSGDVAAVMRTLAAEKHLAAFALVGYSMGGNLVLKLAGELGQTAPHYLKAVVGVSPVVDLAISADALFLPAAKSCLRVEVHAWVAATFPAQVELFPPSTQPRAIETIRTMIRQFDDRIIDHCSTLLPAFTGLTTTAVPARPAPGRG